MEARIVWKCVVFVGLLCSQLGHALPNSCESLLRSRTVRNAISHLLGRRPSDQTSVDLRARFKNLSPENISELRNMNRTVESYEVGLNLRTMIRNKRNKQEYFADFQISGTGKNIVRALLALSDESVMNKAKVWQARRQPEPNSKRRLPPSDALRDKLTIPLRTLNLNNQTFHFLIRKGFTFVGDLVLCDPEFLLSKLKFNGQAFTEVTGVLAALGLHFKMTNTGWPYKNINPVVTAIARDMQPRFEVSDWTRLNEAEARLLLEALSRGRPTAFIMNVNGKSALALMSQTVFLKIRNEHPVQNIPDFSLAEILGINGARNLIHVVQTNQSIRIGEVVVTPFVRE